MIILLFLDNVKTPRKCHRKQTAPMDQPLAGQRGKDENAV
jgi:hypothetical protein